MTLFEDEVFCFDQSIILAALPVRLLPSHD
jgi:hypothetical protein